MRFKLYFSLENPEIPIQYRKCILSFFKFSLSQYNEEYYKKFYDENAPIMKPYTFSVYFKNPKIQKETIILEDNKFELNISVADYETGIILYNALNKQKFKKFSIDKNSWILKDIELLMEKEISTETITIKFQSPLCARLRKDRKDFYYSFVHEEFEETVRINIKEQLKITNLSEKLVDNFRIKPIAAKKVIIKFYEKQIECSTGIFEISGDRELLNYLYQAGIGSRRSAGFGMFQVI